MPGRSRRKKEKLIRYVSIATIIAAIIASMEWIQNNINVLFPPRAKVTLNNPPIRENIDVSEMKRLKESEEDAKIDEAIKNFIENSNSNDIMLNQNSISYDIGKMPEDLAKKMDVNSEYGYLAQILVTNNEKNEIMINQITFNANHIIRLNKPHLIIDIGVTDEKVWLEIRNDGWSEAKNINIKVTGEKPENYKKLFGKEEFSIQVDKLDYTKSCEKILFTLSDVVSESSNLNLNIAPVIYIMYEDEEENEYTIKDDNNFLYFNGGHFFTAGGGESDSSYIVIVDTEELEYSASLKVAEAIEPNKMLRIPLYVSADQSCTLDFSISLNIISGESEYTINSRKEKISINASSLLFPSSP